MADQAPAPVSDSKKPWQSKTILLNAILAVAGGVAMLWPPAHVVSDWVNSHGSILTIGWGVLNTALRWISKDAISLSD